MKKPIRNWRRSKSRQKVIGKEILMKNIKQMKVKESGLNTQREYFTMRKRTKDV